MKNFLFLTGIVFFLFSCGPQRSQTLEKSEYQPQKKQIEATIRYLSSDTLKGRDTGSEGIEKAAQYIESQFRDAGLQPYFKTYRDSFEYKGLIGYNIVAYKEGTDKTLKNEVIILGAHYDHIGIIQPQKGDSIANGANDDASGTAVVLELAKTLATKDTKRSLLFVLFSAEEKGLIGSRHLAKRLKKAPFSPVLMLNFEMLGVPMQTTDYDAYVTGYKKSNLASIFNNFAERKVLGYWKDEDRYQVFKRSDNYAFYTELKIPAHTLSSFNFVNFDQYHQVGDEIHRIDFDFMEQFIRATIPGIEGLANEGEPIVQLNKNSNPH